MPRFNIPAAPLIVRPAPFTFPVSVAVPDAFVIETRPVVVKPSILWVAVPVIITGELPPAKVPVFTKLASRVKALFPVANVAPMLMVRVPRAVVAEPRVFVPELENVRLLNVVDDAESVWAPAAPKFTVPVPALNTVPIPVHAPFTLRELVPPFNVPAVRVISPVKVWVNDAPRSNVPPGPLTVRPAPFTGPRNVAVPDDFVMETRPVVVKPSML